MGYENLFHPMLLVKFKMFGQTNSDVLVCVIILIGTSSRRVACASDDVPR